MKLWQKDKTSLKEVERFTIGKDQEMDMFLAPFDVLGSLAHITMLESIGLLTKEELQVLTKALRTIYFNIQSGKFKVEVNEPDVFYSALTVNRTTFLRSEQLRIFHDGDTILYQLTPGHYEIFHYGFFFPTSPSVLVSSSSTCE